MDTGGSQEMGDLAAGKWAAMDTDNLCSIFTRLPFVDVLRVETTCWGWNATVVDMFKSGSASATSLFPEIPWLIFTAVEPKKDYEVSEGEKASQFVNIEEHNKTYPFNASAIEKMNDGYCRCVASSHDWVFFVDVQDTPYLLNPFTSYKIDLPVKNDLPQKVILVDKAVLSSSPSVDKNYYLAIIYGFDDDLAFCKDGDSSWTNLHRNPADHYDDIIFHKNQLYGLYKGYSLNQYRYGIRVWDMNQDGFLLAKNIDLVLEELIMRPPPIIGFRSFLEKTYLVESQGNLLFVTRFVMHRVSYDSEIEDLAGDATSSFYVFKLDSDQNFSSEVMTSLSGFSLFLGTNGSISVDVSNSKTLKQDAIYFNGDFGQFSGVFSLKDSSWVYGYKNENRKSVATWVVPSMKRLN